MTGSGITLFKGVYNTSTTISGVTMSNCLNGVDATGSDVWLDISESSIDDSGYYGIYFSASGGTENRFDFSALTIDGAYTGIAVLAGSKGTVSDCLIKGTDTGVWVVANDSLTISGCVVDSSTTNGIWCLGSNATMSADTVSNATIGVFCSAAASPGISGGTWIKSNSAGVKCDGYSNASIRNTKISGNGDGVTALNSVPDLGYTGADSCSGSGGEGGNSFKSNSGYHVSNLTPGNTIVAECNYWGPLGPKANKFSGTVDYDPYTTSDPLPVSGDGLKPEPEKRDPVLPKSFALHRNYPNPFNPSTIVRYDVPAPGGDVDLAVFSVRGQLVKRLASGHHPPGVHSLVWEGRNRRGESVSSGIYFLRMKSRGFDKTIKLVLLK